MNRIPHLHLSPIHTLLTILELLIIWIPIKLVAANFEGRSSLASAVLNVL